LARIWIDILTPKQVYFLAELTCKAEVMGHEVLLTTRHYREVNELLALKGIEAIRIGRHGGSTLKGKLEANARRVLGLIDIVTKYKPDVVVSSSSPEAARVAFGLGFPHIYISDSPHAEAVCRLTIPLSRKLITPKIIPKKIWRKFGATPDMVVQYDALDPVVWIRSLHPDPHILDQLNLDSRRPIITFRAEEAFAAYLLGVVTDKEPVILPVIKDLMDKLGDTAQFIALPRYGEQAHALRTALGNRLIIPKTAIDGPSLLSYTSIFIGAGGTMTTEAALLGVPTISCYPGQPTLVEEYLVKQDLVFRVTDPEKAAKKALRLFSQIEGFRKIQQEKAKALIAKMEDPVEVITRTLEPYLTPSATTDPSE